MSSTDDTPQRIDVLTLFPEVFPPLLRSSILGIAAEKGRVDYHLHNIRNYASNKHRKVDDRPYGGGPGMVIQCQPVFDACEAVEEMDPRAGRLILLTPQGRRLDQPLVEEMAQSPRLMLLCGHYEGFDERIRTGLRPEEVSIGDYVLSSGEVAAMVLIDAVVRLLPGVLGHADSPTEESFADQTLEYPHYTRPEQFRGMKVPPVLLSGDHGKIAEWRRQQAARRTERRRADLLKNPDAEQDDG
jgi:tRNA (guanine37-N1)-methyltransferase